MPDVTESSGRSPSKGDNDFFVVGIGASAGGIGALREFFSNVAPNSGMAYVVVLHLSPQHESNLAELLQSRTQISVTQITESIRVEPNHIYVIPPSKYLMMLDGVVRLTEPERSRGAHTSIDLFFRTLADAYGRSAVAILLSGTGADGTVGLGRVREQGGFVIVQDPNEAEYDSMPRSAIQAGLADMILPVAEIPAKILALHEGDRRLNIPDDHEPAEPLEVDENVLRALLSLLRVRTGHDFSQYRRPTLLRRIGRRMQVHEIADMGVYLEFLRENTEEVSALLRDLLITVTNFFRDHDAFEFLEAEIVPELFVDKTASDQIRVWSVGCATGEEAYSLAILLAEHAQRLSEPPKIQVFATDIDDRAIAQARECRYPGSIALDVSPNRLRQFFTKEGDQYQLGKQIREMVLFAAHNVLRDPPFSRLDLISCRNLLIYLNREMQGRVLEIFHFALKPNGYLFLGSSESAENVPDLFQPVDKKKRVYQRRAVLGTFHAPPQLPAGRWRPVLSPPVPVLSVERSVSPGQLHQEVVEQFGPPSALVNEEYDLVHASANAVRYLQLSGGEPTRNLLKLALPELQLDLRSVLLEARARNAGLYAAVRRVRINLDGESRTVTVSARRVSVGPREAHGFFLVLFDETNDFSPIELPEETQDGNHLALLRQLEQELQQTKDQLRITIEQNETSTEELRASNEELQAINEELRSATEELETSKEELQSVNEELTTVNQEYKEKIEEVGRANSDLQNLMASIDIATIFLDRALNIKRNTPRAQQLFNITPTDIGRPLEHFTSKLDYASLHEDAERVLDRLQTIEREVKSRDGSWYLARLSPYRTVEDKIDGVVLTFVDITNGKQIEERLEQQTVTLTEQAEILNLAQVLILDRERRILVWRAGCEQLYGYPASEALGKSAHELLQTVFPCPVAEINAELEKTGQWKGELIHTRRDGQRVIVASHWILHRRQAHQPPVILEVNSDITARRMAEEAAREADRKKDVFLATLAHELRNPLSAMASGVALLRNHNLETTDRVAGILDRQITILSRMVEDLLDVERLTQGRIVLRKNRVTLKDVIGAALENCRSLIDAETHRLTVSVPEAPIYLDADITRLAQIVSNLLDNAFKYTPAGGAIDLIAETVEHELTIRVRDSGIGIERRLVPRIFDMYFQGQTIGSEVHGLGIGLALVKQLAEAHGGSVQAISEGLGKGSEFIIRLPVAETKAEALGVAQEPSVATKNSEAQVSRKILVVDDNRDAAEAMAMLLTVSGGHDVKTVYDSSEALRIAHQFMPEMAILDIGLPGLDGYQLARRLREKLPNIVLVALSGWRIDQNSPDARDAGFDFIFVKPLEAEKFEQLFDNLPSKRN